METWKDVYSELISFIPENKRSQIISVVLGNEKDDAIINPIYTDYKIEYGEFATLQMLWKHANEVKDSIFYYCHMKGVTHNHLRNQTDAWRRLMAHFLFNFMDQNEKILQECDAVGSLFTRNPWPHYSGNFWAATNNHIKNLNYLEKNSDRTHCEPWIATKSGKYFSYCPKNYDPYITKVDWNEAILNQEIYVI